MSGLSRTHFFIARVLRIAACISHGCRIHAWQQPETFFCTPETAHTEKRHLLPVKRIVNRRAVHSVPICDAHFCRASAQRLLALDHDSFSRIKHMSNIAEWRR